MTTVLQRLKSLTGLARYQYYAQFLSIAPVEWQYTDWEKADTTTEACFCRSRGGSKTFDFVNWVVLRVLTTGELWIWLAAKQGQLNRAFFYFKTHKFVQKVTRKVVHYEVQLWDGHIIMLGIVSTSNLGLRVDGIIMDEEEDLEPKQAEEIYPQMAGMMSTSPIHKFLHLGTRWIGTVFDKNCETLQTYVHPWWECTWISREFIENEKKYRPAWEIEALYECKRGVPGGPVFPLVDEKRWTGPLVKEQFGIDCNSGSLMIIGVVIEGEEIYITSVRQIEYNHDISFIVNHSTEVEDGGFNSKPATEIASHFHVRKQVWTRDAKSARLYYVRPKHIHSPFKEVKMEIEAARFDAMTGLYVKNQNFPAHKIDAFLHACHQPEVVKPKIYERPIITSQGPGDFGVL